MRVDQKFKVRGATAFTWTELLVVLVVLGVLAIALLPGMTRSRTPAHRIKCVNHLKNIGLAFRIYATDNHDQFPTVLFTNAVVSGKDQLRIWAYLTNELSTPWLLYCTSDLERKRVDAFANLTLNNISYFVGLNATETEPQSILGGDRNIQGAARRNGLMTVHTNMTNLSWTMKIHKGQGNILLGDGSVQQLSSSRLGQIITQIPGTQRWLFPEE